MWKSETILKAIVLILITMGIVMLASTSGVQGELRFDDPQFFLKRQVIWLIIGLAVGVLTSRLDYHQWQKFAVPLAIFSAILLAMAVTPGVGQNIKGSSRWLRLGAISVQPSEIAKFSTVLLLAWWMASVRHRADEFKLGVMIPLGFLGLTLGLIFVEPDFGTTVLIGAVGMMVMFVGGTRMGYLIIAAVVGLAGFVIAVMQDPERMRRVIAFSDPERYAGDEAFQLLNAIYAFVVGGGQGVGLGQSVQKRFYLPESHTDFIFAILGEELGIGASIGVVLLFTAFLLAGLRVSFRAPDKFGRLLSFGLTLMITLQAAINIGVVTGSLPTKGIPLPFISFGGSSLVISLLMTGVLINVASQQSRGEEDVTRTTIKDRAHRL